MIMDFELALYGIKKQIVENPYKLLEIREVNICIGAEKIQKRKGSAKRTERKYSRK